MADANNIDPLEDSIDKTKEEGGGGSKTGKKKTKKKKKVLKKDKEKSGSLIETGSASSSRASSQEAVSSSQDTSSGSVPGSPINPSSPQTSSPSSSYIRRRNLGPCSICQKQLRPDFIDLTDTQKLHPECFLCATCQSVLDPSDFYEDEGKYYCASCESAAICSGCGKNIQEQSVRLPGDLLYHPECLKCKLCGVKLGTSGIYLVDGAPRCEGCADKNTGTTPRRKSASAPEDQDTCHNCKKGIDPSEVVVACKLSTGPKKWHLNCFQCHFCHLQGIDPVSSGFVEVEGEVACGPCAEPCGRCNKAVGAASGRTTNPLKKAFHVACLKCSTCSTPIKAANNFLELQGALKCQSCYDKLRPQSQASSANNDNCFACKKGMGNRSYVTALGRTYHRECFACKKCGTQLNSFVSIENHPHCDPCAARYDEERRATTIRTSEIQEDNKEKCFKCSKPFSGAKKMIALEKKWHVECFVCTQCQKGPLQGFLQNQGLPYCETCHQSIRKNSTPPPSTISQKPPQQTAPAPVQRSATNDNLNENCSYCGKGLGSGKKISALGKKFHQECFVCVGCGKPLDGGFVEKNGEPHCGCLDADPCGGCGQLMFLNTKRVTALGKKWHPQCFVCSKCRGDIIAAGFFQGKSNGLPYCQTCIKLVG